MADRIVTVTNKSWGSRLGNAFGGVIFGLILFVVAFPLLFWNEGNSVKTYKSLKEGEGAVVSVDAEKVDPASEGKLVHVSGLATTPGTLDDAEFGISAVNAIQLQRAVEMYQWSEKSQSETRKKLGGGEETVTTYTYSKTWSDDVIASSNFQEPTGHENPGAMRFASQTWQADDVTLGAFELQPGQVLRISSFQSLPVPEMPVGLTNRISPLLLQANTFYMGKDPAAPAVGDLRISFKSVKPQDVSVIAKQSGSTFVPYPTKVGKTIDLLELGRLDAQQMFANAHTQNKIITWLLRVLGWFLMFIGLSMVFKPLSVLADVLPFLGSLVGMGTGLVAFLLSVSLSLLTIAIAWFIYRPLLGIILLGVAVGAFWLLISKAHKKKDVAPPAAPPAAPAAG